MQQSRLQSSTAVTVESPASRTFDESQLLAGVIQHPRLILERGEGSYVWDVQGRRYLDFTSGLAVAALGHGRRDLADILADQFAKLGHCSNLYGNVPAIELAERLCATSFATRVWFANSGTEANEAAFKFARVHANAVAAKGKRKNGIVAFKGGFHGRTAAALAATYHPAYRAPFAPLIPGVRFAPFDDLAAAAKLIDERTAAVIVEPVQGEGGVVPASPEFMLGLRKLCDEHDALLILDEVQCGLGRIGSLYAYQAYNIVPDMVTLAKPLAGGLPLGAVLLGDRAARHLRPGQHGSTFSGGPAVCAVASRVLDIVSQPEFLAAVIVRGHRLRMGLETLAAQSPLFTGVRGRGLMRALVLAPAWKKRAGEFIAAARKGGLLVTRGGDDAIRLLPTLVVTDSEIDAGLDLLGRAAHELAPRARRRVAATLDRPGETR